MSCKCIVSLIVARKAVSQFFLADCAQGEVDAFKNVSIEFLLELQEKLSKAIDVAEGQFGGTTRQVVWPEELLCAGRNPFPLNPLLFWPPTDNGGRQRGGSNICVWDAGLIAPKSSKYMRSGRPQCAESAASAAPEVLRRSHIWPCVLRAHRRSLTEM